MELDFLLYEKAFGTMYHLLIDKSSKDGVRFVNDTDNKTYATVNGSPVFFNWDKEFRIAIEFTIMFPKIYVKKSIPYLKSYSKKMVRNCVS